MNEIVEHLKDKYRVEFIQCLYRHFFLFGGDYLNYVHVTSTKRASRNT